jgi:hypothetical protein
VSSVIWLDLSVHHGVPKVLFSKRVSRHDRDSAMQMPASAHQGRKVVPEHAENNSFAGDD